MDEKEVARATARLLNAMCDDPEMLVTCVDHLTPHTIEVLAELCADTVRRWTCVDRSRS